MATSAPQRFLQRGDVRAWLGGLVFVMMLVWAMHIAGGLRGWDATSGYHHNRSLTSSQRFLPEPFIQEPGVRGRYGSDPASRWYYWKLPPTRTSFWSHLWPWLGYACHQILVWAVIYHAQLQKSSEAAGKLTYQTSMSTFNWVALALNVLFHILHFINTHTTYDALAQDVSIASSQCSVIMLTVVIYLMEYNERGLFFGWPLSTHKDPISQRLRLDYGPVHIARKYHGYAFSWAAIYTFWYHPMENTLGHYMGFIGTWLFMLQGSLMFTEMHLNKYWRFLQEVWVAIHAGLIAFQTGGPELGGTLLWPMFFFGFTFCIVTTQVFGLPLVSKMRGWKKGIPFLVYICICVCAYSRIPDGNGRYFVRINEIFRIPTIYYLYFLLTWGFLHMYGTIKRKYLNNIQLGIVSQVFCLSVVLVIYAMLVGVALYLELWDVQQHLMVLTVILLNVYIIGACVSFALMDNVIQIIARDQMVKGKPEKKKS